MKNEIETFLEEDFLGVLLMDNLSEMLDFCSKYKHIVCYGAGDYAERITIYLRLQGITVEAFCISDTEKIKHNNYLGREVYHLSNVVKIFINYAIIVAVNNNYHNEIQRSLVHQNIKHYFFAGAEVINDVNIQYEKQIGIQKIKNCIYYADTKMHWSIKEEETYKRKVQCLKKNFEKIEIHCLATSIGGCLVAKKYYDDSFKNSKSFILLYPNNSNISGENDFKSPNEFVLLKFKGHNYESLCKQNIDFWRFALINYEELFEVDFSNVYFGKIIPQQIRELRNGIFYIENKKYIKFSDAEKNYGQKMLNKLGIKGEFFSFFARDGLYYKKVLQLDDKLIETMDVYRNSDVQSFKLAAEMVCGMFDMQAVRVGKIQKTRINGIKIIDYASDFHDDFLDIYLAYKNKFLLSDPSGVNMFAATFSKPIALTNMPFVLVNNDGFIPLSFEKDLMVFQKYWDKSRKKYLSFKEMIKWEIYAKSDKFKYSGITNLFEVYYKNDIIPVKNTEQEILDLALEMNHRIDGTIHYSEEEDYLQEKFRNMVKMEIKKDKDWFWYDARVGTKFLLTNQWLLD